MSGMGFTATGMVLSARPVGESDKLVVLLSREQGKIKAFARAARRPHSPLLAATNAFAFGEFQIQEGRTAYSITQASVQNYFSELLTDFEGACYGQYFLEFVDYYTRENVDASDYLKLLYQSLRALLKPALSRPLVKNIFELKAMVYSGECPQRIEDLEIGEIHESTAYAFSYVVAAPIEKLFTFTLTNQVAKEFASLVKSMRTKYVEHRFKSLEILETCL